MYEFGETIGGLDRCYYFGYGKDLYHFDHFMGNLSADLEVLHHLRAHAQSSNTAYTHPANNTRDVCVQGNFKTSFQSWSTCTLTA